MEMVTLFPFVSRTVGISLQGSTKARVVAPPHQTQSSAVSWQWCRAYKELRWRSSPQVSYACLPPLIPNRKPKRPGNGCVLKVAKLLSLDYFSITCFTASEMLNTELSQGTNHGTGCHEVQMKVNSTGSVESCPPIQLWFPENYHLRRNFVCHLKSRISHSGRLTILFPHFVSPVGVFQHLKQFPVFWGFWFWWFFFVQLVFFFEVGKKKGLFIFHSGK